MLILSRKIGETIVIGDDIEITISSLDGDQIKIGITAPQHVKVYRKELLEAIRQSNKESAVSLKIEKLRQMINLEDG